MHSAPAIRKSLHAVLRSHPFSDFICSLSDSTVSNDWRHSLHLNNSLEGTHWHRLQDLKISRSESMGYFLLCHSSISSRLEIESQLSKFHHLYGIYIIGSS